MPALDQNQNQPPLIPHAKSILRQNLTEEFRDKDYRYAYAESFLNTRLASQIKMIRQQRELTQAQVAELMGIKQSGYARFEDVNHSVWKTDTLWNIARALDVRVNVSLETFGSLIDEKEHFDKPHIERPAFDKDPAFHPSIRSEEDAERQRQFIASVQARNAAPAPLEDDDSGISWAGGDGAPIDGYMWDDTNLAVFNAMIEAALKDMSQTEPTVFKTFSYGNPDDEKAVIDIDLYRTAKKTPGAETIREDFYNAEPKRA